MVLCTDILHFIPTKPETYNFPSSCPSAPMASSEPPQYLHKSPFGPNACAILQTLGFRVWVLGTMMDMLIVLRTIATAVILVWQLAKA